MLVLVSGCAAPVYTVDDGSQVDETLLAEIRAFGKGHQVLRPGIVRSAALKDKDCDKQWELPFVVATSYDLPKEKKIAWVRGLSVDERLSVIAASENTDLSVGDKIEEIDGYKKENTVKMHAELMDRRDSGRPFTMRLASGKAVKVNPVEVCRGRVLIAAPENAAAQDFHWLQSTHSLSLLDNDLTPDEALWTVLWTQGLSEEAGARMKVYHYGLKVVKTGIAIASVASGVGAVANAANAAAANAATTAAGSAAAQAAARELAKQAADSMRKSVIEAAQKVARQQAQEITLDAIKAATMFKNSLSGISWVAGTGFYMADKWAFDRMETLGADPLAAFTLHYKLASTANAQNAFVFDEERLQLISEIAKQKGMEEKVALVLAGEDPHAPKAIASVVTVGDSIEQRPLEDGAAINVANADAGGATQAAPVQEARERAD
ncbi:hypothetical protein AYR66_02565 [Noviherbaspirillum denitrificans]|uniref:Uncharacterized protein n=1 Tax=Noviherbaspirillum denitrificans TaxID=1968433 RepID=A0A254T855_9BURK|nr:hypothetical protein AYR66_02565 [Noviherbaspirillum denitrificans]